MEEWIVWVLAAYGCSSLLARLADKWADRLGSSIEPPHEHYWLLLRDSEQVLERVVRRLLFRSYWNGKPIRISLIDSGSTDDTRRIASAYARCSYTFRLLDGGPKGQQGLAPTDIIIDLRQETTAQKT